MFAKMLNAILFARQNTIYAVVYVLACFCEFAFFFLSANGAFHLTFTTPVGPGLQLQPACNLITTMHEMAQLMTKAMVSWEAVDVIRSVFAALSQHLDTQD